MAHVVRFHFLPFRNLELASRVANFSTLVEILEHALVYLLLAWLFVKLVDHLCKHFFLFRETIADLLVPPKSAIVAHNMIFAAMHHQERSIEAI